MKGMVRAGLTVTPHGLNTSMTSSHPAGASQPSNSKRSTRRTSSTEPTQLRLLDGGRATRKAWQLDARTRRIGRERVAEAREILRRAQPPEPGTHKIAG
jgi:hypothetical protein